VRSSSLTSYLTQCKAEQCLKKHSDGRYYVQTVGRRLDFLAPHEARRIALRILEIVHGRVQHMRVVMKGEQADSACIGWLLSFHPQSIDNS